MKACAFEWQVDNMTERDNKLQVLASITMLKKLCNHPKVWTPPIIDLHDRFFFQGYWTAGFQRTVAGLQCLQFFYVAVLFLQYNM